MPRTRVFFLFLWLSSLVSGAARAESAISIPALTSTALRHAAHRLSDYTNIPLASPGKQHSILFQVNATANPKTGAQGYTIRTSGSNIAIGANTEEGLTNGAYTLLRTLMIEHREDPFSKTWSVEETPHFSFRAMQVAPYRFGGSYGFAALSPDRWSIEEWEKYLDFMRLANMTTFTLVSGRVYDPDYPNSEREHWRYDVWKQVMDYCHQIGLKFDWMIAPNMVSEQAFWDNPDKRATQEAGAWYGNGLSWKKGKETILRNEKHSLEAFKGLDALEIIYSDGGGFSFDDDTADPAAYFADATNSYIKMLRESGNDANFIYWNWVLDFWSQVLIPEPVLQKYPKYRTMQDDILPLLPKNVAWLDASILTNIGFHWPSIQGRHNPPLREGLMIGKEHGFKPVIDFFWYMNPEFSINMFPHPYIGRAMEEAKYARDEIGADGTMGYRLAPPCKFVDDYIFFRLSSDPSLTQEQLVNEAAGLLTTTSANQKLVAEAINGVEHFWTRGHHLEDLQQADQLLKQVLPAEKSKELQNYSNGVTFLTYIVRLAQPGMTTEQKIALKRELYNTIRTMYIFQGIVADIVWLPEALRMFNARLDWMVEEYKYPQYGGLPFSEVIDRSIYPKATSQPFTLQWPKKAGTN